MNKFIRLISIFAPLAVAVSCLNDEIVPEELGRETVISATIADPDGAAETRTCIDMNTSGSGRLGILWQPSDAIGVYGQSKTVNAKFYNITAENAMKADFRGTMVGSDAISCAYYPYSAENDGVAAASLQGVLPNEQNFDSKGGALTGDYKYGLVNEYDELTFHHIFSLLRFDIDVTGTPLAGERLHSIELSVVDAGGVERGINGAFKFSALDGTWSDLSGSTNKIVMPWVDKPLMESDKGYTGFMTVLPTICAGDRITVSVVSDSYKASFTATNSKDFAEETVYTIPLRLKAYAENAAKFNYSLTTLPTINEFKFMVKDNTGKLLDNKTEWKVTSSWLSTSQKPAFTAVSEHSAKVSNNNIDLMIPYLYDFKLVPTFSVASGAVVTVGNTKQESGKSEVDFTNTVTYKVTLDGATREYEVNITNTGLPVVVIEQSSEGDFSEVTSGSFLSKKVNNEFVDFMIRGKDTDWVTSDRISIYNADGSVNVSAPADGGNGGVRLRGNTSQEYPKKPFAIKFTDKQKVLDMPKHKRWVLLANWLDHSMIRNTVAFDIAHAVEKAWENGGMEQGIPWNVHGQNVELVIDGHHVGNYYLCEQIKIGGSRLDIQDGYDDIIEDGGTPTFETCGYLFEIDNNYDEPYKFYTGSTSLPFMFKDEHIGETKAIYDAVVNKINGIDRNIYSGNYSAAYNDYDINSAVDQWLIYELTMNREYCDPRSVYHFMDGNGKVCAGPVWDFDRATFQNPTLAAKKGNQKSSRLKYYDEWVCWNPRNDDNGRLPVWYGRLINDPIFQAKVQERWAVMYPYLQNVSNNIREYGDKMAASYEVNNAMWPTTQSAINAHKSKFYDWSGDEEIEDWNEVIDNFVQCYEARLSGMNTLITTGKFTK